MATASDLRCELPPPVTDGTGDNAPDGGSDPPAARRSLFGVQIDAVTLDETVERVLAWCTDGVVGPCRYVVTPNVNHIVRLQKDADFLEAYDKASLVVADGWPVVTSAKLLAKPLPERVAGSDVVPALLDAGLPSRQLKVFLLGGKPGIPERAAERIGRRWPGVEVVGALSPSFSFTTDDDEQTEVIATINEAAPDLLVVGLGAPKQEVWLSRNHRALRARTAVAGGATIDFLAGEQTRAPRWVQAARLEWVFRIGTNPRRLAGRYLNDGLRFPGVFAKQAWRQVTKSNPDLRHP